MNQHGTWKEENLLEEEIRSYFSKYKMPFVLASWGMTLDGKIANKNLESRGINGKESIEHLHYVRNSFAAILIGTNTAMLDNPQLNVREAKPVVIKNPLKLIIDKTGRLDESLKVFNQEAEKTYVVMTNKYSKEKQLRLQQKGIKFIELRENNYQLDLHELMKKLTGSGVNSLLVEGGSKTLASFLKADLLNGFHCYISPKIIAGLNLLMPFQDELGINLIKEAKLVNFESVRTIGEDILIKGSFIGKSRKKWKQS